MRIFKLVFGGLLIAVIVGAGLRWGYEKIIIGIEAYSLRGELENLQRYLSSNTSTVRCDTDGSEASELLGYQLRFVTDTDYVLESVCESLDTDIVIKTGRLKYGVVRWYGSGVMLPVDSEDRTINGWVHLKFKDTVVAVGYFGNQVKVNWKAENLILGGDNPARANCSDWGFVCCKSGSEIGEGPQVNTFDCPTNCSQTCNQLPVTLYFNTDPLLDPTDRTLKSESDELSVYFGFEVTDFDGKITQTNIDFGDGEMSEYFGPKEDLVIHEYSCHQPMCEYQVKLMAEDEDGNDLVDSKLNQIMVVLESK